MTAATTTAHRLPPVEQGPCRDCYGEPTRTLGRFPYCDDCADELRDEIRARIVARDGIGFGVGVGRSLPEYGPRQIMLACIVCPARWVGRYGEPCRWCQAALDRQRRDRRAELMSPSWLQSDAGDPRYDELSEIDRRIWDRLRRPERGEGSLSAWGEQLGRAVQSGLISDAEASAAIERSSR